ncbi:MAG: ABC transporter ATP-binding protein [Desulfosarcina sp.]|nr:ABC transporter ATP-binding protein [Desulfosarcina sp.]MBC2743446.1 ABC transporter ATP-binding protein [Desulfosarcina sp.]MBC2766356.1 ABC transporter ATP-binding protein [Desulfosarcina sp.]
MAVDHVSLMVRRGETLGLVGESGSGKSTVGNCLLRLLKANSGRVLFNGQDILSMKESDFHRIRGKLQVVFQDPQSSLDPRMTVQKIVGYPLRLQQGITGRSLEDRVMAVLKDVGLQQEHVDRYPHEFSGGQRQRIGIARALITGPEFIVFDEPTSALDVSVQAQILNLIGGLQKAHGYTYLFISHDLAVVRHISSRIAVMYLGSVVEASPKRQFFSNPCHPYTKALIASVPRPDPLHRQNLAILHGDVPSPLHIPTGCRFHPRCPEVMAICRKTPPPHVAVGNDHWVDCHLYT